MLDRPQGLRDSDLNALLGFLFAHWRLITASVVMAIGAALLIASWQGWLEDVPEPLVPEPESKPPIYTATAVYNAVPLLSPDLEPDASVAIGRHLARSYQFILGTPSVAQLLVDHLELEIGPEEVQSALTFASSPDLSIITVTATGDDAAMVLAMANGVGSALATSQAYAELDLGKVRGRLEPLDRARQARMLDPRVEPEPAAEPSNEPQNKLARLVATAAAIGLLLGTVFAVCLDQIRGRAHYPRQVVEVVGLNPLGTIDRRRRRGVDIGGELGNITGREPFRVGAAIVRRMKSDRSDGISLLVTSPGRREGKTTIVAGLADALAEDGSSVVIVSGDLRSPSVIENRLDQVRPGQTGLSEYLTDPSLAIDELLEPTPGSGVHVIPRGRAPGRSAVPALGSDRMRELLDGLKLRVDWILLDSPGVLGVADAAQVSRYVDGTILVVDGGRSRLSSVEATVQQLRMAGANLTGFFHNRPRPIPLTRRHGYSV